MMHDDLQMMRQLVMEQCFLDGQIPCRWTQYMGFGYGFPLFNYYPPLPYLVGEIFRLVGFSFVNTAKFIFALAITSSGVTMYLLGSVIFPFIKVRGKKVNLGAILAAAFYVWAPYHAVDIYVRGAMNEAWALVWFPLVFWAGYKLVNSHKTKITRYTILLGLSYFALFVSHNLMVMLFTPVFGLVVLIWLWQKNKWTRFLNFVKSGLLALGLSAFFVLPVLVEKKLVQIDFLTQDYFEYFAHFATSYQLLFSRYWGYGGSVWEEVDDGMSFSVGHLHWILSLVVGIWIFKKVWSNRKRIAKFVNKNTLLVTIGYLFVVGWFSVFLSHSRSTPIWKLIKPLEFVQFPWRFLAISTFCFSLVVGVVPTVMAKSKGFLSKNNALTVGFFITTLIAINWNYFLPSGGKMGELTDEEKFSGAAWQLQQGAGVLDYLPVGVVKAPDFARDVFVEVVEGEGDISNEMEGSNWARFEIATSTQKTVVRLGIFDYPDWRVFVDGNQAETFIDEKETLGRIYFEIDQGNHKIEARLFNTPIRKIANAISLVSWIGLFTFPLWKKNEKEKKQKK